MKKLVLFVILDQFADWEGAYVSSLLLNLARDKFEVKTVSLTKDSVRSIGGLTALPDYDVKSAPDVFEGLILVGGMSWRTESARQVIPLVDKAVKNGRVLGAICDASAFLGTIGLLNDIRHTTNDVSDLKQWAKEAYTGEDSFVRQQAVRDGNIITANGTAALEFASEVLVALDAVPESKVREWVNFYKRGVYEAPMPEM